MLLQKLTRFAKSMPDIAAPMYDFIPVRYVVDIDPDTLSASIITLTGPDGSRADRGLPIAAPTLVRSTAIRPKLLADNAEYALGWAREGGDPHKVDQRHQAFVELINECADQTRDPDVRTVARFLAEGGVERLPRPADFDPAQTLTFHVQGRRLVDAPEIQDFWVRYMATDPDDGSDKAECLVCGRVVTPVERLQYKIKGAPGGQKSGTSLISANAPAFESYGLRASRVAPVCDTCADQFSKALNRLIADERNRLYAGGQLFVFWTDTAKPGFSRRTTPPPRPRRRTAGAGRRASSAGS